MSDILKPLGPVAGDKYQINYNLFEKILTNNDFRDMDMYKVAKRIYEITWVYCQMDKALLKDEVQQLEKNIIKMTGERLDMEKELASWKSQAQINSPKESQPINTPS